MISKCMTHTHPPQKTIMKNTKYSLELFLRVVTVGLETMKIVNGLPELKMGESK